MRWLESECTGEVVFLGGGKIMGCLNLGCDVDFIGTLVAEMNEQARTVKDMEKEWKGYNERAHAREEVTRWGGRWHRGYEDEEDEDVEGGSDQDGSGDLPYPMPR